MKLITIYELLIISETSKTLRLLTTHELLTIHKILLIISLLITRIHLTIAYIEVNK